MNSCRTASATGDRSRSSSRKPGTQRAFARGADFVPDRVVVAQVERAQERPERESLEGERAEHDRERGQHDQVAKRKRRGQRQRRRQRDDAAHAGPRDDQAAADRRAQHRARRMKTEPAIPPSDDGVEGHVPGDPDDDHGHEDGAGDGKVPPARRRLEARQNRPDLQADEDEGQHVQQEDHRLPHGVRRDADPRGDALGRRPRHRHGVAHHGEHARQADPIGQDPDAERGDELKDDGRRHVLHAIGHTAA